MASAQTGDTAKKTARIISVNRTITSPKKLTVKGINIYALKADFNVFMQLLRWDLSWTTVSAELTLNGLEKFGVNFAAQLLCGSQVLRCFGVIF